MVVINKRRRKREGYKFNNDIDRKNSERFSKAKSERKRRVKIRERITEEVISDFDKRYIDDLFNSIKGLEFTHILTLRFNQFVSIEYAEKAAIYFSNYLIKYGITSNQFRVTEYGKDRHIHLHFSLRFNSGFVDLYTSDKAIEGFLHKIWNNDMVQNGAVFVETIKNKYGYLRYLTKELIPKSKLHFKQKQIDYWYIQSFKNEGKHLKNKEQADKINSIETDKCDVANKSIFPHPLEGKSMIKPKAALTYFMLKHRYKFLLCALVAVLFLFL